MQFVFIGLSFLLGLLIGLVFVFKYKSESKILKEQLTIFQGEKTKESEILQKIAPVTDTVKKMQEKIELLERDRTSQYKGIEEQMKNAIEGQARLQSTTAGLATALKSNQVRGSWGELELKRIVESTGMTEHVSFDTQESYGENRPDMIIKLPEGKEIIIDSKVNANHYLEACNISDFASSGELEVKNNLLKQHAKTVKEQVNKLSSKEYWKNRQTPDFVIMFIPSEAMLSCALENDPSLLEYAFSKKIALASPVSLFSVLKTVSFVWQQQLLTDNAKELGDMCVDLFERVKVIAKHSTNLEKSLEKAVESYNSFASSLERNVFTQANKIAQKLEKTPIDEQPMLEYNAYEWRKKD